MTQHGVSDALSAVLRALPDATLLVLESGIVDLANARANALLGYSEGELAGKSFEALVAAADWPRVKAALASGRGCGDFRAICKDASPVIFRFCINAIDTIATSPRAFVVLLRREVTEPCASKLLAGAPDAIIVVQGDGRIVLVNDRAVELFGYATEELLGRPVSLLVPERVAEKHTASCDSYFRDPHVRPVHAAEGELFGRRKDGSEFPVGIMLSPVHTASGVVAVAAVRDATDQRALEDAHLRLARAEEAMTLRDEFVSLVAHELRTPLTAVRLLVDGLVRRSAPDASAIDADVAGRLQRISSALARAERVVDDLIDVARVLDEGIGLTRENVDLAEVVRSEVDRFRAAPEATDARFDVRATKPVFGRWDRARLQQLVVHLLSNAIKYGGDKPIEVTVDCAGECGILSVRDEGLGIPPEARAKLFERFARFGSSRHYGGLGLGLWMVKEVVTAHGGQVEVASTAAGATFRVALPMNP